MRVIGRQWPEPRIGGGVIGWLARGDGGRMMGYQKGKLVDSAIML